MPIIPFLRGQAFDPELIEAMSTAFTKACDTLGLVDRADPVTEPCGTPSYRTCGTRYSRPNGALFHELLRDLKQIRSRPPCSGREHWGRSGLNA